MGQVTSHHISGEANLSLQQHVANMSVLHLRRGDPVSLAARSDLVSPKARSVHVSLATRGVASLFTTNLFECSSLCSHA
ncbi:copper-transporting ATPase [Sesbania bispinosa]|nr:copper-transporting ATPase [Sesbania bispinosa]